MRVECVTGRASAGRRWTYSELERQGLTHMPGCLPALTHLVHRILPGVAERGELLEFFREEQHPCGADDSHRGLPAASQPARRSPHTPRTRS